MSESNNCTHTRKAASLALRIFCAQLPSRQGPHAQAQPPRLPRFAAHQAVRGSRESAERREPSGESPARLQERTASMAAMRSHSAGSRAASPASWKCMKLPRPRSFCAGVLPL